MEEAPSQRHHWAVVVSFAESHARIEITHFSSDLQGDKLSPAHNCCC
jgi:hypothetical protein